MLRGFYRFFKSRELRVWFAKHVRLADCWNKPSYKDLWDTRDDDTETAAGWRAYREKGVDWP